MKKQNKLLIVLGVIALYIVAWYTMFNTSVEKQTEYDSYITAARQKAETGIVDAAVMNYRKALEMRDSIELRSEIAGMYKDAGRMGLYVGECEQLMELYPTDAAGYELMADYCKATKSYYACYEILRAAQRRGLSSETLEAIGNELKYAYEVLGDRFDEVGAYSSRRAPYLHANGFWGYLNTIGSKSLGAQFMQASVFTSAGYASVQKEDGSFVVINTTGSVVYADPQKRAIEDLTMFLSGKMAMKLDGKYTYVNEEFEPVFGENAGFNYAGSFNEGVAAVKSGDKWRILGEDGEFTSDNAFDEILMDCKGIAFRSGAALAFNGGTYQLIDKNGETVTSEKWEDARAFETTGSYAAVKSNGKWGYIDASGNYFAEPKYEDARSFMNNMAAVCVDGKWGYIDAESRDIVIEPTFFGALDFNDNGTAFVRVTENEGWQLIRLYRLSTGG